MTCEISEIITKNGIFEEKTLRVFGIYDHLPNINDDVFISNELYYVTSRLFHYEKDTIFIRVKIK